MAQLKSVVDPFGEINVFPAQGTTRKVVATILMSPYKEGTQTGIALDGSASMRRSYGEEGGTRVVSSLFASPKPTNEITPIAQKLCSHLARHLDADGGTTVIYWAVGPNGAEIEVVGDLSAEQAERHAFGPPKEYGTGTQLLPAVRYFCDRFRSAAWGFYVFITDGELHDLDAVIAYSKQLAQDIARGQRNPLKLVLIGVGPDVSEYQMQELDDLDTGSAIDLWDHKIAKEMRVLEQIFAEVVDQNTRVADHGRILDPTGRVLRDYAGVGLPAYLEFEVPAEAAYFTLEVNGSQIHQTLDDSKPAPPSHRATQSVPPPRTPPAAAATAMPATQPREQDDPTAAEWKDLPLEFEDKYNLNQETNVDLDKAE
ncbi:MAG: VWA domain-containing protein [Gemmataceae bacterium]